MKHRMTRQMRERQVRTVSSIPEQDESNGLDSSPPNIIVHVTYLTGRGTRNQKINIFHIGEYLKQWLEAQTEQMLPLLKFSFVINRIMPTISSISILLPL